MILFPQDSFRCLITNYHVISEELEDNYIELELYNKKVVKLLLDKNTRIISFFKRPKDITVIQINDQDIDIIENVDFLNYDMNYLNGYDIYEKENVFALGFPKGKNMVEGPGKITNIFNNYEFWHNIPTDKGSSGSPILLNNNGYVIGVHKKGYKEYKINEGTFIGVIIDKMKDITKYRRILPKNKSQQLSILNNLYFMPRNKIKNINNNFYVNYKMDNKYFDDNVNDLNPKERDNIKSIDFFKDSKIQKDKIPDFYFNNYISKKENMLIFKIILLEKYIFRIII